MKRSSSELKRIAKGKLLGNYSIPMGAVIIFFVITFIITFFSTFAFFNTLTTFGFVVSSLCEFIVSILLGVLSAGMSSLFLNFCRNKEYKIGDILYGFRNYPDHVIGILILLFLMVLACFLPVIILTLLSKVIDLLILDLLLILFEIIGVIASIILMLTYSQAVFLYIDDPHMKVMDALRESKEMMRGNKVRLFYLIMSFFGLLLLCVLSCYIGMLWIGPYMNTTLTLFYLDLRGELPEADSNHFH